MFALEKQCSLQSNVDRKRKSSSNLLPCKRRKVLKEIKSINPDLKTRKHVIFDDDGNPKECFVHEVSQHMGKLKRQANKKARQNMSYFLECSFF